MNKLFKKTTEDLRKLRSYISNISQIQAGGSAVPALYQVSMSMMVLSDFMVSTIMEPLLKELHDLQNNNGPQAQFQRRYARSFPSTVAGQDVETLIKFQYPNQYPDREEEGGLSTVVQGLIPNIEGSHGVYKSKYGENTINVYPPDQELITLVNNWAAGKRATVAFDDGVVGMISPTEARSQTFESRDWAVELIYKSGSRVTFYYTASGLSSFGKTPVASMSFYSKMLVDFDFQELVSVLQNEIPSGQQYINQNYLKDSERPPLQMACQIYNAFEDMTYPGTHAYITHGMVRKLMQEWLRVNDVKTDQTEWEYLLDDKLRYQTLLPKIHEHAHPGDVPMFEKGTVNWWPGESDAPSYNRYSTNKENFEEYYIVDSLKDPTKREHFIIRYCERNTARHNTNYNVLFTFTDETESCTIKVYSVQQQKFVNPTPRTIHWLTEQMLVAREAWVIKERKRLEDEKF